MHRSILFAKAFISGKLNAFPEPIEDMDAFAALSQHYSPENADIEGAVMEFAHGSCHLLTLALAETLEVDQVMIFRDPAGLPVHSGLYCPQRDLLLDANGIHHLSNCLTFWVQLAGSPLTAKLVPAEQLAFFFSPDEDDIAWALESFASIHRFIEIHLETPLASVSRSSPSMP